MKKLIVISGGSKGIGRSLVKVFVREGFDIMTCSRNQKDLDRLENEMSAYDELVKIYTFKADLNRRKDVDGFIEYINSMNRPVDVLVNNAGLFIPGQISNEPEGRLEEMINTNLYSAY
jgi:short-subunit dehydrogenase